jgi:hypothetical protein
MKHRKPPKGQYARSTRDTTDEYAEHRIKNCDDPERVREILKVEVEREEPRENRVAWCNQRLDELAE